MYCALPRIFAAMKSIPGLNGKDLHGQSQCFLSNLGSSSIIKAMSSLAMPTPASPAVPATGPAQLPTVVPTYACEQGIDAEKLEAARVRLELLYGEVAADWPGFIARPG